jgi:cytoskeletal protein RodZ
MGHFGDKFREAREKRELTLDQVSNVTKISSRMLKAIEEEHFDQLPGGVFNKGFIRAYAKHLGLNDEEAVNDYLACLREAQVDAHEVWEPQLLPAAPPVAAKKDRPEASKPTPKPPAPKPQAPAQTEELPDLQLPRAQDIHPPRRDFTDHSVSGISWRLVTVAAVTVVLAGILWVRHSRVEHPATAMANSQPTTNQPASASTASSVPASSQPNANPAPALSNSVSPAAQAGVSSLPAQPASTTRAATAATPAPAGDTTESSDVTVRRFDKSVSKSSDKESNTLTLVIRASENSWVSVLADGQVVTQETLIAPANTSVHASRQITVRVGNAAGISFLFNGQEVPAQGDEAEVRTVVFDASGFKSVPTQPPPTN